MTNTLVDIGHLIEKGWVETNHYFELDAVRTLKDLTLGLIAQNEFRPAAIRSANTVDRRVRRDSIFWLEDWETQPCLGYFKDEILSLGKWLSGELRVGLNYFEGHLSHYGEGSFYLKHLDQHIGQRHRQITLVSYLNDCEGGELVVYNRDDRNKVDSVIKPTEGKLVLFLSPFIFHEVRTSGADRYGLTGWFRDDREMFGQALKLS